jgi:aminodeoxyfutalosine deaminase
MHKFYSHLIHNGTNFLPTPSTIICSHDGTILYIAHGKKLDDAIELPGLICPGFINAHCHLELSYLQHAVPQHTGLIEFINTINTVRHNHDATVIAQSIVDAEQQMMANGIVAVGDISNTNYTIAQKQKQHLHYHTFVEIAGVLDAIAPARYAEAQVLQTQFSALHNSTIVPHAPYSVSTALFAAINDTKHNAPISIHNQECQAEDDLMRNGIGEFLPFLANITNQKYIPQAQYKSSLQYYLPLLQQQASILFVHNTCTSAADILFAQQHCQDPHWVLCPKANLYIENKLPTQILELINQNQNICIGTDSLASNNTLDIYSEIQTLHKYYPSILPEKLLKFATSNGAKALQMPLLGDIQIGKQAGLIHIANWETQTTMPQQAQISRLV